MQPSQHEHLLIPEVRKSFGDNILKPLDPNRKITAAQMGEVALWRLLETEPRLGGMPETLPPVADILRVTDGKAEYEMRFRVMPWNLDVQGNITPKHFADMVGSYLADVRHRLTQQQSTGDWVPCAYRFSEATLKQFGREKSGHEAQAFNMDEIAQQGHNRQQTKPIMVSRYRLQLEVAYIDRIQGDPIDNWQQETGKVNSLMARYAATRELRNLPPSLKAEREKCTALIREFYGLGEDDDVTMSETDAKRAATLSANGLTWGELGKIYGLPWQTVKKSASPYLEPAE